MVGLKLLSVACLIASVYASPHFTRTIETSVETGKDEAAAPNAVVNGAVNTGLGGALGGLVKGIVNTAGNIVGGVTNLAGNAVGNTLNTAGNIVGGVLGGPNAQVGVNVGLGGVFKPLIGALTDITGNAGSILNDLAKLKIPGTVDDVLNLLISVGASAGDIVNAIIPGIGTDVSNLVVGLSKMLICILGSPGLTGNLLGDRRPGFDNPKDIPAICRPNFGGKYGAKKYNGSYDNAQDVYNFYDLADLDSKIRAALDKATNGEGVDGLTGSQKYVVQWILQLTGLVKQHPNGDFSQDDINTLAALLVKIIGGIGNSYQVGLGDKIATKLVAYLDSSTNGTTISINLEAQLPAIKKAIDKCKPNDFGGAIQENNTPNTYVDTDGGNDQGTQTTSQQNDQTDNNSQTTSQQNDETDNNSQTSQTTSQQNDETDNNSQTSQTTSQQNDQTDSNSNQESSVNTQNSNNSQDESNDGQQYQYNSSNQEEGSQQDSEQNSQSQQTGNNESGQQVIQDGDTTTTIIYSNSNNNASSNNSSKNSSSNYKNSSSTNISSTGGCQD